MTRADVVLLVSSVGLVFALVAALGASCRQPAPSRTPDWLDPWADGGAP